MKIKTPTDLKQLQAIPIIPLKDLVLFPNMVVPIFIGRDTSLFAIKMARQTTQQVILLTQKESDKDDITPDDLYRHGTLGNILQTMKMPDGSEKVLIEGIERVEVLKFEDQDTYYSADVLTIPPTSIEARKAEIYVETLHSAYEQYAKAHPKITNDSIRAIQSITSLEALVDTTASHLPISLNNRQEMLNITNLIQRIERLIQIIYQEIDFIDFEKNIKSRVKQQIEQNQKEYYLNEQMKAIQQELDNKDGLNELQQLEEKIQTTEMSAPAKEKALGEFKKLKFMNPASSEGTVVRNYIDTLLQIPWTKRSKINRDLMKAMNTLEADHYGLDKIKERIIEYLAVQQRKRKLKGPILCLVGPPGVGKTSLGKSIANAIGRKYIRMALGGVRDEAEIRGHRRTYIGAMPGQIIQKITRAGVKNPLFLLDEIDKMSTDFRGDPASAMLEVLDPEQNNAFNDHYLDLDYDLSDVMFVATANSLDIPCPLLDRMEIIQLSGYTEDEKYHIAEQYLISKQMGDAGLKKKECTITKEAIIDIIRYYTREAGVRSLERDIAKICRKVVKNILTKVYTSIEVNRDNLKDFLGVKRFKYGIAESESLIGQVTGLAWTQVGGELLNIEVNATPGKGKILKTGKLGDVMLESIQAAMSVVRTLADDYKLDPNFYEKTDVHVHVPEGATPKDGPSAGLAMCTAILSALTKIPVRYDVAMTGEITLRGRALPIGGLKEKLLAALRGGITTVLIPEENVKDLEDIPDNVKTNVNIIPVENITDVLKHALDLSNHHSK